MASEDYVTLSVELFCLTVPKNFVGKTFCAVFQKIFGSANFMDKKGGEFQDFPSKIFCLIVLKKFVGEPFRVSLISGIEEKFCLRGFYDDFPPKFFCLTVPKNFIEEPFCAVPEKFW